MSMYYLIACLFKESYFAFTKINFRSNKSYNKKSIFYNIFVAFIAI